MKMTKERKKMLQLERAEEKRAKAHKDKMWNRAITKAKMKNDNLTEIKRKNK